MKLFLSGGGSGNESEQIDAEFIKALDKTKPVLYIPIAIDTEKHPYSECLEWLKNNFQPFGFDNFVMWTEEDLKDKKMADFEQFGGIYIGGGNTFKLLKELKEFGTFETIKKLALSGLPIYGGSAGAIIMAKTIIPASSGDENIVGLTDFSAMNLIKDAEIWCHYNETYDETIKDFIQKYNFSKVICIPETAGILVSNTNIVAIGPSDIVIFNEGLKTSIKSKTEFWLKRGLSSCEDCSAKRGYPCTPIVP